MGIAATIRVARASDHTQLQALFGELDRVHQDGVPWLLRRKETDPREPEWLQTFLVNRSSALFVADVGTCAGLATVYLRDAPSGDQFISQQHAVIDDLIVHPSWRRKGIAGRLCDACEEWALERKASWIEANVYEFNADACEFYAAVGFETTMRRMRKPLASRS
jgi:diamine N-acetyltransferase